MVRLRGAPTSLPPRPLVHERFESHVERAPQRLALTCGPSRYTYAELDRAANRLAHLLGRQGLGPGSIVGICLDRSPEMVIAVLAVLKAGAAYSPLDPTYPEDRLRSMIGQLPEMRWLIASDHTRGVVGSSDVRVIVHDEVEAELASLPPTSPTVDVTGDDLCYVVFTSGSTGVPKAAGVRHIGWYNLLAWLEEAFKLDAQSTNLMLSPFGFDISQRSLLAPLFTGATLHLLPSRHFDAMLAHRMIHGMQVRTLHCAPSALYLLAERHLAAADPRPTPLEYVFVGGEPLSAARLARWCEELSGACQVVNVYGVAECSDVATFHVLTDPADYDTSGVPIGAPIHNVDVHLLDEELLSVGGEDVGEICISGTAVGAGYFDEATLDDRRFVTLDSDGAALDIYRTGDLGQLRRDGQLAYVGRMDDQIKVRGMRFAPADVEAVLRTGSGVADCVVVAVPKDGVGVAELVACVVPNRSVSDGDGKGIDGRALRSELLSKLPGHMVPERFVTATEMPLNPNGKVDRRAVARRVCESTSK